MEDPNSHFTVPGLFPSSSAATTTNRPIVPRTSSSDDVIRDRSAVDTLRFVLANSQSHSTLSHHDRKLVESFQAASTSHKSFVTTVADCAKSFQEWCQELDTWSWSGNFEPESASQNGPADGTAGTSNTDPLHTRLYGGLSALQLKAHRNRLRHLQADLDKIDMAEMKDRALVTHLHANSLQPASYVAELHQQSPSSQLDVLSALVTVALLEALPDYSRVQTLAQRWNARISVLELAPSLLTNVAETKNALVSAWKYINDPDLRVSDLEFEQRRVALEEQVASLGQTVDFMLDTLEGLEDTLPGEWIDNVEMLEEEYSSWVVAGRKRLLKYTNQHEQKAPLTPSPPQQQHGAVRAWPLSEPGDASPGDPLPGSISSQIDPVVERKDGLEPPDPTRAAQEPFDRPLPALSPVLERRESDLNDLMTLQSFNQAPAIQQSFNFQPREMRQTLQLDDSAHNRAISMESVDSQIANPDGSYRFSVSRRQSIYRTASMATIGTIGRSQIRSVDLSRHARGAPSVQTNEPRTALVRSQSAEELQAGRDFDGLDFGLAAASEDAMSDKRMTEPSSLDAIIQDITEKFAIASSAIGAPDEDHFEAEHAGLDVESQEPMFDERELALAENSPKPSLTRSQSELDGPDEQEPVGGLDWEDASLTPTRPPRVSSLAISTDEQIDRRIDRILTTIPTRINFNRRAQPEQTLQPAYQTSDAASGQQNVTSMPARSQTPALTLAPAELKEPRAARKSGNSAIRLYYLSQAGRQHPIKLYVRLVGENGERVMVRVGGGWADLGEYLRDYASHHSRTVIPEPNEQLQAVDLNQPTNSRVFSLPAIKNLETSPSATPPESPMDEKRWSGPKGQKISKMPADAFQVPSRGSSLAKKAVKKMRSLQDLSLRQRGEQGNGAHEPTTADSVDASGPQRLSAEKKEWLEQMVSKAKKWKAEGGTSQRSQSGAVAFGLADMGSAGATRRVYRVSDGPLNNVGG